MVLYFKLDDLNRLWLCFCTGLKLKDVSLAFCSKRIRVDSPIMKQAEPMKQVVAKKGEIMYF